MTTPNYSKSEWGSLSIQERIRAMNKVAGDDESIQNSIPEEEQEEQKKELPKRSSVVDIWRKREGPGGISKEKKSPVSVPWPDEEEEEEANETTAPTPPPTPPPIHVPPKRTLSTPQQQQLKSAPSWKSQKTKAPKPVEEKEADLTILPSTSTDQDEEVAAASHSKSVMDVWTKKALTIPDSPMTVVGEDDVSVSTPLSTPARSSVVDIWTKRTTSGDVPSKRSAFEKAAAPPLSSESKQKESPLKAWNKRKTTPVVVPKDEEDSDLVVVQDDEKQQESESPKTSSAASRYKQLAQLRHVPPRPVESTRDGASEFEEPKPSSVVNRWNSHLRKTHVKPPSPVTTNTEEDDENTQESDIEESKPSSVVNRWKPRVSGESPQLRKAPVKVPSPVVMLETADSDANNKVEEPKRSSIMNRWNPQGTGASPQLRKAAPMRAPSPVSTSPTTENVEDDEPKATAEEPKRPSIASRWNPQGNLASPPLRKVPTKPLPVVVAEPPAEVANGEGEQETKEPTSAVVRPKKPTSAVVRPKKPTSAVSMPKRSAVAGRWNPQGTQANVQLRKVPVKNSLTVDTTPSAEVASGDEDLNADEPTRSVVTNRWNPKGSLASPQLRKVINKVATPLGAERSVADGDGDRDETTVATEPKRSVAVNRWKPQGTEATPQLRKAPFKRPPSIITEPETEDAVDQSESTIEEAATRPSSVANRWNPQGNSSRTTPGPPKSSIKSAHEHKKPSVLDRYNPQRSGATPRAQEFPPPAAKVIQEESGKSSLPPVAAELPKPKPSVLDRYKPSSSRSEQNTATNLPSFSGSPFVTKGVPASTGEETGHLVHTPRTIVAISTEESSTDDKHSLETKKRVQPAVLFDQPFVEPVISLPFDESPTTKLFASIDMSKSSGSTDLLEKADDIKVYDSTDADGFPTSSNVITKSEASLASGEGSYQLDDKVGARNEDKLDGGHEIKAFVSQQPEKAVIEPKPLSNADQRSKAMELFASRRKHHHVAKVEMKSKSAVVEKPVPKSPEASPKALASSGSPSKDQRANGTDVLNFQSGTSAFVPSPKEAEAVNTLEESAGADLVKRRKRSKRPKSMKEFMQKHRRKGTTAAYSYDTISSRSSASVGTTEASEKPSTSKRGDLIVDTSHERAITSETEASSSVPTSEDVVPMSSEAFKDSHDNEEAEHVVEKEATPTESDTVRSLAGETEEYIHDDEPGRIVSKPAPKPQENEPKSASTTIVASPSPRTRTLQDRRRIHNHGFGGSPATPNAHTSPVPKEISPPLRVKRPTDNVPVYPALKPVYQTANSIKKRSPIPSQSSVDPVTEFVTTNSATSRSGRHHTLGSQKTATANSDAGASDTLSFFSAASSGYASTAISSLSVDRSLISPASSLSNRASRALIRRRRKQPSKEEEKGAAQELAQRMMRPTLNQQPPAVSEEVHEPSSFVPAAEKSGPEEEHLSGPPTVPENDKPRGPGLSGRYNTSSRFVDSVQSMMKDEATSTSFDSGTTEGSSQIRSVESTSDSEGWTSRRARESTSSLNRVPSDSTDGVSFQSSGMMTNATNNSKTGHVVTESFVSESSSNLEALKSAYKAVSLHQIAMDLTDEVSVATTVDLKKIASDFNETLRTGLSSLNGGSSSASNKSPSRKLKVPTASSESRPVDEEVAIEVEYMEDSDEEDEETVSPTTSPRHSSESENKKEESMLPAGEPSQESSAGDRRRAYV